ncbi:MAG: hypothetical protein ACLT8C_04855 [Akkermansia muciniphila]
MTLLRNVPSLRIRAPYGLGWDVRQIDGHDIKAIKSAVEAAKNAKNGKPQLIIAKTVIGKGIPGIEGTTKGHGEGGAKLQEEAHANWEIPAGERYYVSEDVRTAFADLKAQREKDFNAWNAMYEQWRRAYPELAEELDAGINACSAASIRQTRQGNTALPAGLWRCYRSAGAAAINAIAKANPAS